VVELWAKVQAKRLIEVLFDVLPETYDDKIWLPLGEMVYQCF